MEPWYLLISKTGPNVSRAYRKKNKMRSGLQDYGIGSSHRNLPEATVEASAKIILTAKYIILWQGFVVLLLFLVGLVGLVF